MKISTRKLCITAMMLTLAILGQYLFRGTSGSQLLTGAIVNVSIIITTLYCGILCGSLLGIITPITAYFIAAGNVILAIPIITLGIILGNITLSVVIGLVLKAIDSLKIQLPQGNFSKVFASTAAATIIGSIAKALVMTVLIVLIILPTFADNLQNATMLVIARKTFSVTQLITALIGSAIACVVWPSIKAATKHLSEEE